MQTDTLSRGLVLVKWWLLALPHYLLSSASSPAAHAQNRERDPEEEEHDEVRNGASASTATARDSGYSTSSRAG